MNIKASSKYDRETIRAMSHLSLCKRFNPKKILIAVITLILLPQVVLVVEGIMWGFDSDYFSALFAALFAITLTLFWYYLIPLFQYKSLAGLKDAVNRFVFTDESVFCTSAGSVYKGESEFEYALLVKAYETSRYFFLYQTKQSVYIVDKNTVSGGTADEIAERLKSELTEKFIRCKY